MPASVLINGKTNVVAWKGVELEIALTCSDIYCFKYLSAIKSYWAPNIIKIKSPQLYGLKSYFKICVPFNNL